MRRLEETASWLVGILLPVLETFRRGLGHWRADFSTLFEDYAAGVLPACFIHVVLDSADAHSCRIATEMRSPDSRQRIGTFPGSR